MRLSYREINSYLGNTNELLQGEKFAQKVVLRMIQYETRRDTVRSGIDEAFLEHHRDGRSLRDISREIGIAAMTLSKIFDIYGLPHRDRNEALTVKHQDENFKRRNTIGIKRSWKLRKAM